MSEPAIGRYQHAHQTALITGGCSGLGLQLSHTFLEAGANVVVADVSARAVEAFQTSIPAAYPDSTLAVCCDVSSAEAVEGLFARAEELFGRVDYVVNNAGVMDRFDPVGDVDAEVWERVMRVNLTAPAVVMGRAVRAWVRQAEGKGRRGPPPGVIVNIASIAGVKGFAAGAAYTASKHGLLGLTKNTAAFYGPKAGVRCNAIMAGAMDTDIFKAVKDGMNLEGFATMRKSLSEESTKFVNVDKMAKLVLYLCSDEASIINGAIWTADGGTTAN